MKLFYQFIIFCSTIFIQNEDKYIKSGFETVYGKSFMYQVKCPSTYIANIPTRSDNEGNIKFTSTTKSNTPFEMYILDKNSKKTADAISYVTRIYSMQHSNLKVHNIEVKNFPFECTAKFYTVPNKLYDYVFYINCGTKYKYWIIATAHNEKRQMNERELTLFYELLTSINPIK